MLGTTGTFTSCKDYDDDITNLQDQITANADAIKALQDKINSGKWITELTSIEGGFKVTFSDGQSFEIVNGADGAKGEAGTQITIGEDGYWYFDGVKSEYKAVVDEESKTKAPYISEEDGYWYFFNEEGEAVKSEYKAVGASYAVKVNGGYNLYLPDANGDMMDPIFVAGAAASINSIRFDANLNNPSKIGVDYVASTFEFAGKTQAISKTSDWKGTKALPKDGSVIYTQATPLLMRIDPVTVAAEEIPFTLINSHNETLPNITLKAKASDELIKKPGTRSAANNGLFTVAIDPVVMSADQSTAFNTALGKTTIYALNADNAARSAYEIEVLAGTYAGLTKLEIGDNNNITIGSGNNEATVDVNKEIRIKPTASAALYDMYIVVKSEYENVLKITYSDDKQAFTINKNADETTPAEFPMTIYTCDVKGQTQKTEVTIKLSQSLNNSSIYEQQEYNVSDANGFFPISLDVMKKDLSDKGLLDTWKIRVKDFDGNLTYALYSDSKLENKVTVPTGLFTYYTVKSDVTPTTSIDAPYIIVVVDNSKQTMTSPAVKLDQTYYLRIGFNADGTTEEVNYISVPVMFTAPAVSELFTPESALIDSDAATGPVYELTKAFKYTASKVGVLNSAKIKFTDDKVGETGKKASELAAVKVNDAVNNVLTINNDTKKITNTISLIDVADLKAGQYSPTELGYGQVLPMVIEATGYDNWAYQDAADKKYSFKVDMMSALYEGEVKPVSGTTITVSANAESAAIITSEMIKGYDYNNNEYEVIPNKVAYDNNDNYINAWTRDGVLDVEVAAHPDYANLIKSVKINPATIVDKKTVNGNIELQTATLSNDTEVVINVYVTDVWGYTNVSPVKVLVKINK